MSAGQLARFALEDDGRTYTISTSGVRWRRDYLAPWMNGRTGTKVSVRHLPHHDDTIEIFDATTGRHLGSAFLAAAASREQIRSVQAARSTAARRSATRTSPACPRSSNRNLNLLGRYNFTASVPAAGALRPLRDPDSPKLDEDDDGSGQE
ncbi:Mu transposase C-terminal domain-containing protein [Streptomyces sp. NBC_01643]|nr:Mu transposase C-terminal domain-containing protein [Streptomyces sp. NBC_01643]